MTVVGDGLGTCPRANFPPGSAWDSLDLTGVNPPSAHEWSEIISLKQELDRNRAKKDELAGSTVGGCEKFHLVSTTNGHLARERARILTDLTIYCDGSVFRGQFGMTCEEAAEEVILYAQWADRAFDLRTMMTKILLNLSEDEFRGQPQTSGIFEGGELQEVQREERYRATVEESADANALQSSLQAAMQRQMVAREVAATTSYNGLNQLSRTSMAKSNDLMDDYQLQATGLLGFPQPVAKIHQGVPKPKATMPAKQQINFGEAKPWSIGRGARNVLDTGVGFGTPLPTTLAVKLAPPPRHSGASAPQKEIAACLAKEIIHPRDAPKCPLSADSGRYRLRPLSDDVTTLAIRNVPARYTVDECLREWPPAGQYDFMYLPDSNKDSRPKGCVFINFTSHDYALDFQRHWQGQHLTDRGKNKHLDIIAADLQGYLANLQQFKSFQRALPHLFEGAEQLDTRQVLQDLGILEANVQQAPIPPTADVSRPVQAAMPAPPPPPEWTRAARGANASDVSAADQGDHQSEQGHSTSSDPDDPSGEAAQADLQEDPRRLRPLTPDITTLAVRNIPARYRLHDVLATFPPDGTYDFLHLPYSFKDKRTLGFVFINFVNHQCALEFQREWQGQQLLVTSKVKNLDVTVAEVQGFRRNLEHFRLKNPGRMTNDSFLPALFNGTTRLNTREVMRSMGIMGATGAPGAKSRAAAPTRATYQ